MLTLTDDKLLKFVLILGKSCVVFVWGEKLGCPRTLFIILLTTHITKLSGSCFYYLYNIRRLRKYLSRRCAVTLVHAFVSARIDYCNSILYGIPDCHLNKLQRIQNAAARLVCQQSRYCHITPLLFNLHWLPVKFQIVF